MNPEKTRKVAKIIAVVIIITMIASTFSFIFFLPSFLGSEGSVVYAASNEEQYLDEQSNTLKELILYIQKNYKDDVSTEQLMNGAFNGVITSLNDPYSVYYKTDQEAENFQESVSGEFSGVGIVLQYDHGYCKVVTPVIGGPAERAGILAGDKLVTIDGKNIANKNVEEVAQLLRGQAGTKVTITVDRQGKSHSFHLTREMIHSISVNAKMLDNKIGYLQITSFDVDTHQEFKKARQALINDGATSFIVDVRNNPGGFINTAAKIADQLMPAGPITHLQKQGKIIETVSATGNTKTFYPTVLLVNKQSASASEILAGALKDSNAAKIVGTTTFGKGVAQQVVPISENKNMKLSMYYFITPKKTMIDHVGISPDYTVNNVTLANKEDLVKRFVEFAPMSEKVKPKLGDLGLNVFGAQQRLSLIGYDVKTNGVMDSSTVETVKKFQTENGLTPYGVLDYTTMAKIERCAIDYLNGVGGKTDLQLNKGIELLQQGKVQKL